MRRRRRPPRQPRQRPALGAKQYWSASGTPAFVPPKALSALAQSTGATTQRAHSYCMPVRCCGLRRRVPVGHRRHGPTVGACGEPASGGPLPPRRRRLRTTIRSGQLESAPGSSRPGMRSCRTCGAATTNSRPKWGHATAWPPRTPNSRPPSDRPGTSTASACPTPQQRNSARRSPSCTYTGGRIRRRRRRSPSWSYLRPPRVEPTLEVIAVDLGGARIAETRRALRVLETSHPPAYYLPRADVAPPVSCARVRAGHGASSRGGQSISTWCPGRFGAAGPFKGGP